MFGKGMGIRLLAALFAALLVAAGTRASGELTPEQRRALEKEARTLNEQGFALYRQGKFPEATAAVEKALAMTRRLYPKGHSDLAQSLSNLGGLLQARGDLDGAERHHAEALTMSRRLYPKGNLDQAQSLNNLGGLLQARGDLGGAERHLREALAMRRRFYTKDHPHLAQSLSNLGFLLQVRGDLGEAEKHYRDALAMFRRLYPKGHPDLAQSLNNLGSLLQDRGDLAGAEKYYREALAMFRRLYPKGHPVLAGSLNNLGVLLQVRGDLDGAERHHAEALAIRRRFYPKGHPDVAQSLNNLGGLLRARGIPDGAEKFYRDSLAMNRGLYSRDHPSLATSLGNLGYLLQARGDLGGSERHYAEALAMQQRSLLKEAGLLAEADALNLAASLPSYRDTLLSATRDRPGDITYDLVWQGRSALTRIIEQRHRDLLASRDPKTRKLGDKLLSARQRLSHLLLSPVRDAEKYTEDVRALTEIKEGLEKELAEKLRLELPPADATPPPPRSLAELLPAGAAFLDFYRYTLFEFDPKVKGAKGERRTPHYVAFVLGKDKPAVRVELGEAAPLEKAWTDWHDAIMKDAPAVTERQAAAGLAKLVWGPIRAKLPPGVHTLYLAPDGALTQVPWAALPGKEPDTVLFEKYTFATVPHGPFLLARLDQKGTTPSRGGTLLAVGGVDYHKPPAPAPAQVVSASGAAPVSAKRLVWNELKGTGPEVERVAALAEKHAAVKARRLTGDDATTDEVLYELPRARYAHLATHGFFADPVFRSAFQVDPDSFRRLTPDRRGGARSPLVLSGLVFAGANRSGDEAEDDRGIVTAEALVGLRLDKLELAVLSACNTGLGEVGGGEGVYGLQRAFHVAGCKNVVASLWEVGDQSTAALMALFYRNLWELNKAPLDALRDAQLELYRHPERVKEIARRGPDFTPRPLPKENPNPPGARARTAQWAAFTFSGVAAPPKK